VPNQTDVGIRLSPEELLALSRSWYWEADSCRTLSRLSQNFSELSGVKSSAWIGRRFEALSSDTDLKALFACGEHFNNVTFSYYDSAGRRVALIAGQAIRDARGRVVGWCGTGRDVTAEMDAAREPQQAQELLLGAMESIAEGFALYDADDRLVLFNRNYHFFRNRGAKFIFYGAKFEDIVRSAAYDGFYPIARGREEVWIKQRTRYHRDPNGTFEVELEDGRWIQIIERRTVSGGTVTINTDITSSKRRDEKLMQAQRLQALGQLTGGVAHDFENSLLIIECTVDLLSQVVGGTQKVRSYLSDCGSAIQGARELVRRLHAVARQQPLLPNVVEPNSVMQHVASLLSRIFPRTIEVDCTLSPGVWRVCIDKSQLESSILNLALNSRDAMSDGGTLRLSTANVYFERGWVEGRQELPPGSYVMMTVTDDGAGMTRDVMLRAFEPFFTTKPVGKNCGLGLSMVYGFIKQSGGEIELDSAPGRGTTVRIYLPRVLAAGELGGMVGSAITAPEGS
jgi:signal transduction histidine kinase